jgi:hypothetical protein
VRGHPGCTGIAWRSGEPELVGIDSQAYSGNILQHATHRRGQASISSSIRNNIRNRSNRQPIFIWRLGVLRWSAAWFHQADGNTDRWYISQSASGHPSVRRRSAQGWGDWQYFSERREVSFQGYRIKRFRIKPLIIGSGERAVCAHPKTCSVIIELAGPAGDVAVRIPSHAIRGQAPL